MMGRRKRHHVCPECGCNIEPGKRCSCIGTYKRQALKISRDLCYSEEARDEIRKAKTTAAITRIMVTERSKIHD